MNIDSLINELDAHFQAVPYPGDEDIVYDNSGTHLECQSIQQKFKGKDWQNVSTQMLLDEQTALAFMSARGFAYFLPAYLRFALVDIDEADMIPINLVYSLTLPTDMDVAFMGHAIRQTRLDEQLPEINFNEILQNRLLHVNQEIHDFMMRVNQFNRQQSKIIYNSLNYFQETNAERFLNDAPLTAIQRYWFLYG
jgi:hypothetical protein